MRLRDFGLPDHTFMTAQPLSLTAHEQLSRERNSAISWDITLVALALIIAAGSVLRFYHLGERSLYIDEAASTMFARQPWTTFWMTLWSFEANETFYYLLLRGWIHLGDSEVLLRSFSVLFGVATIPATYLLGKRLFGTKAGLFSAALLAINAYHIRYSQEARSYSFAVFLVVLSTYLFVRSVDSPGREKYWVAYLLTGALAVYSHLYAFLVLIAQWLSLGLAKLRRIGHGKAVWTAARLMLLIMPLVLYVLFRNRGQLNWIPRPTLDSFLNFARCLSGGHTLLLCYAGLSLAALFGPSRLEGPGSPSVDDPWRVRLVALWLVFPIASTILLSLVVPVFYDRYMTICVPALALLAGHGLTKLDRALPGLPGQIALAFGVMVVLSLSSLHGYNSSFAARGDDWRLVTRYILEKQQPGDGAFFYRARGSRPFAYYVQRKAAEDGATSSPTIVYPADMNDARQFSVEPSREEAELATKGRKRVWLVLHHHEGLPERKAAVIAIQAALQNNFRLAEQQIFLGASGEIRVLLYVRDTSSRAKDGGLSYQAPTQPAAPTLQERLGYVSVLSTTVRGVTLWRPWRADHVS